MGNACSVEIHMESNYIVWIDPEVDNDEITEYAKELQSIKILKVKLLKLKSLLMEDCIRNLLTV